MTSVSIDSFHPHACTVSYSVSSCLRAWVRDRHIVLSFLCPPGQYSVGPFETFLAKKTVFSCLPVLSVLVIIELHLRRQSRSSSRMLYRQCKSMHGCGYLIYILGVNIDHGVCSISR